MISLVGIGEGIQPQILQQTRRESLMKE